MSDKEVLIQVENLEKSFGDHQVIKGISTTISRANRNIDTIDAGVPVLSMHAPFEVVSKFDCYMTYKGVLAAYMDK